VANNYSGNLVDLCPVGAITDSEFRFKTRAWFLESRPSVCPLCGRGCSIFIDLHPGFPRIKGSKKILRVRARENEAVNRYWICDIGRYGFRCLFEKRADRVLRVVEGKASASSWDEALRGLGKAVEASRRSGQGSRTVLVMNTSLTNEELDLVRKVFQAEYESGRVFVCDPAEGEPDGFLLTAERSANRRGASERGFKRSLVDLKALSGDVDLLLVFGVFLLDHYDNQVLRDALRPVPAKYLFTPHRSVLEDSFDWILPVSLIAEKSGTVTNCDGYSLEFKPAWDPPGDSRPEADILDDLGGKMQFSRSEP
jgi:NADH-quinone oxidoreductase subunit G